MSLLEDEMCSGLSSVIAGRTPAEPFRSIALRNGTHEDDPAVSRAVGAMQKLESGETAPEEVDAALSPLFEGWNKRAAETPPADVAMPADSNSFRAAPLLESAKQANIAEDNPLLVRALKAQEKADWRKSWASWQEMEIAVWAFQLAYFTFKNVWPPKSQEIEYFLHKLEKSSLTPDEVAKFRELANANLQNWDPDYSPGFKERIEVALAKV